jgi:hypothetical protein
MRIIENIITDYIEIDYIFIKKNNFPVIFPGNYSCLVAQFYLSRSVGFHLVQSYLPTMLIVVISWVSFWMDVDSVPGRTTLGVTTLLAVGSQSSGTHRDTYSTILRSRHYYNYIVCFSGIQSGLPQVSYVKAIDVWMGTCTGTV